MDFICKISELANDKKDEYFDDAEKAKFAEILTMDMVKFLVCDQIFKRFGTDFYDLEKKEQIFTVYFEVEKLKSFVADINKIISLTNRHFLAKQSFIIVKVCKFKK